MVGILKCMKGFLMKQLMKSQIKKLPQEQQEMAMKMAEENPELLMTIAQEVQEEMKGGKDQLQAMMAVAERHKDELQKLMQK